MAVPSIFGLILLVAVVGTIIGVVVLIVVLTTRSAGPRQTNSPNLFPCPDCGRLISLRAETCPHCGGPVQSK